MLKFSVITLVTVLMGCNPADESNYEVDIDTNKMAYTLHSTDTMFVEVTNLSDSSVFYICTCQIYLEEINNSNVINTWQVHGFEECLSIEAVGVDETETFVLDLFTPDPYRITSHLTPNGPYNFRLRFDLFEDSGFKNLLEGSNILSNTFTIALGL